MRVQIEGEPGHGPGWTFQRLTVDGFGVTVQVGHEMNPEDPQGPFIRGDATLANVVRSITAAPDLLRERDALKVERDALLAALRAFVRDRATCPTANGADLTAWDLMRAAIAKAEGAPSLDRYCPCGECGLDRSRWSPECQREVGAR